MSRSNDIANITSSVLDGVTKAEVGLGNVDNTADSAKPVSTAQQSAIDGLAYQSVPHIIPDVLYPAVSGNDLSGTALGGSYVYGTAHTDGRKYYYTDIKGSKPIKDPRIGGHFGSQRHDTTSLQKLEQETATHGKDVFSVDGREWMRAVNVSSTALITYYEAQGTYVQTSQNDFIEVVGYFIDANISTYTFNGNACRITVNGGSEVGTSYGSASVTTPLLSRYVDASSIVNLSVGATLGINTLKIRCHSSGFKVFNIELIAQDTTSTANRSKIQIPSQDVVSYGKKFTVSGTPHYDPFNGFTSGSSVTSYIDTATSLGVENWKNSSTYYRPYNGGRVVKWVDSSGVIKTSVTMMPPNAQNFGGTAITAKANASVANDTYLPTFSGAIDDSLSEVAKHYINEEFGNGSANGGTGATYADASMLSGSSDDIAYVMDDGLTSLSANAVTKASASTTMPGYLNIGSGDNVYTTFIGTGVTLGITNWAGNATHIHKVAFNLPYGTHILRVYNSSNTIKYVIDGVEVQSSYQTYWSPFEFTFHQPKKPPIPEDACVIADYMLMADFVPVGAEGEQLISKGVRYSSASRDHFYDASGASLNVVGIDINQPSGLRVSNSGGALSSGQSITHKLTYFGTDFVLNPYADRFGTITEDLNGDVGTSATIGTTDYDACVKHTGNNLGVNRMKNLKQNSGYFWASSVEIATPIHTSSHYQTFETPFLHELVGGDRNMEQTNLVCTSDGRSWDQITRDTSYMGGLGINTDVSATQNTVQDLLFTEWRGSVQGAKFYNKGFAIAYDRVICLKAGRYRMFYSTHGDSATNSGWSEIRVNGKEVVSYYTWGSNYTNPVGECVVDLVRGDFVQVYGTAKADMPNQSVFNIEKV